jgi:hypothetical protein
LRAFTTRRASRLAPMVFKTAIRSGSTGFIVACLQCKTAASDTAQTFVLRHHDCLTVNHLRADHGGVEGNGSKLPLVGSTCEVGSSETKTEHISFRPPGMLMENSFFIMRGLSFGCDHFSAEVR